MLTSPDIDAAIYTMPQPVEILRGLNPDATRSCIADWAIVRDANGTRYAINWEGEYAPDIIDIGPLLNWPIPVAVDYREPWERIDGDQFTGGLWHTGGGCMAYAIGMQRWEAARVPFEFLLTDWADWMPGYCRDGFTSGSPEWGIAVGPNAMDADDWADIDHLMTIMPDPSQPDGWPTADEVRGYLMELGDRLRDLLADCDDADPCHLWDEAVAAMVEQYPDRLRKG